MNVQLFRVTSATRLHRGIVPYGTIVAAHGVFGHLLLVDIHSERRGLIHRSKCQPIELAMTWKLSNQNREDVFFYASDLGEAEDFVKRVCPERFYGCNITHVDPDTHKAIPNGDFVCIPVRGYYEDIMARVGEPMPV